MMRRHRYIGCIIALFVSVKALDASRIPSRRALSTFCIRGGAEGTSSSLNDEIQSDAAIDTNDLNEEPVVVLTEEEEEVTNEVSADESEKDDDYDAPFHDETVPEVPLTPESEEEPVEGDIDSIDESLFAVDNQSTTTTAAREDADKLRQAGKQLHDEGDWQEAADKFHQASLLLQEYTQMDEEILQEYATCRLHEALCRLKSHDYKQSVEACTAVLEREPPAAIRARALHRSSRAKLGMGLTEEALLDARQAAFLGDRKAVALYGKLMRQDSSASESSLMGSGSNPFLASGTTPSSSALLESLLNKSGTDGSSSPSAAGGPLSMLLNGANNNGNTKGGLAKSVLSSLTKTVEKESTQENICRYLQNTNIGQVQQMATMAGIPLSESHASRLVNFCHGVTPRGISKSVKTTRRLVYVISVLRKVSQIISKYRIVFILWALSIWIQSALKRPIPINKRAMKQALQQGIQQPGVV